MVRPARVRLKKLGYRMQPVTEPGRSRLKFATQVHAEAVSIVALRALAGSIGDHETPAEIRARIHRLIEVKADAIGLNAGDFDADMDRNYAAIEAADRCLEKILKATRA